MIGSFKWYRVAILCRHFFFELLISGANDKSYIVHRLKMTGSTMYIDGFNAIRSSIFVIAFDMRFW